MVKAGQLKRLLAFIEAREAVRVKRAAGAPPPWTDDPILRDFRFCNIRREDDRVTKWLTSNWTGPHAEDQHLWFAMTVARHLNLIDALAELGYPVPWNAKRFLKVVRGRMGAGLTAYNAAYMIRAGKTETDKAGYLVEQVFRPLWRRREKVRPAVGDTLESFHTRLQGEFGLGSFMAAQVLCDVSYRPPLLYATDWDTFAASGPGSRRGLNRVLGRETKEPWSEEDWRAELSTLRERLTPLLAAKGLPHLHARNVQNVLCEYDKYLRTKLGEGRPKQRYDWAGSDIFR